MKVDLTNVAMVLIPLIIVSGFFLQAYSMKQEELSYGKKACEYYLYQTGMKCSTKIDCFNAIRTYNQLYNNSQIGYCNNIKTRGEYIRDYEVFSVGDTTT